MRLKMKKAHKGFTLIEVMITVAIIGILAAIAVPSYIDYVKRGRIPEALAELSNRRVIAEQFFMDNRTYTGVCALAQMTVATRYFNYACAIIPAAGAVPQGYTLTATGIGSMDGFGYTITNTGTKATNIDTTKQDGWTNSTTCWVIKKGGVCA